MWQNSWGLTTRSIGVLIMVHGDDRGLVLLLDDRYYAPEYAALLPAEWIVKDEDVLGALKELEES